MRSDQAIAYSSILRELRRSLDPARKINKEVAGQFRRLAESRKQHELENARMFLRAQREHKKLLERYNPLFDMTAQERIKATARRVGLDMPVAPKS